MAADMLAQTSDERPRQTSINNFKNISWSYTTRHRSNPLALGGEYCGRSVVSSWFRPVCEPYDCSRAPTFPPPPALWAVADTDAVRTYSSVSQSLANSQLYWCELQKVNFDTYLMTTSVDNKNTYCEDAVVMDVKLVHEVRKHPALYDPKIRSYKDSAEMDKSWLEIANELGMKRKSPSIYFQ